MSITYLGHSAFEIELETGNKILIDPFLIKCPNYNIQGVTDIFVTHAHADHLGNSIEISQKTGATITAIFELANYCATKSANTNGINLGGWIEYDWGKVIAVPAFHSSSTSDGVYGGCACGYIFKLNNGQTIYHAGDTCLSAEMKLIKELYAPNIVLLPIGGQYTMDIAHATIASDWLGANYVIPMHYNTFAPIMVDINIFIEEIKKLGKEPIVLKIGEKFN